MANVINFFGNVNVYTQDMDTCTKNIKWGMMY